jgi:hypothetical protein
MRVHGAISDHLSFAYNMKSSHANTKLFFLPCYLFAPSPLSPWEVLSDAIPRKKSPLTCEVTAATDRVVAGLEQVHFDWPVAGRRFEEESITMT